MVVARGLPCFAAVMLLAAASLAGACGGDDAKPASPSAVLTVSATGTPVLPTATPDDGTPHGAAMSRADLTALTALFSDNPLLGGQVAPRLYKWVNDDVALFLQLDTAKVADAAAVQYVGIARKGVFCTESQGDKSFSHFDRLSAATYGQGAPSQGEFGYWLSAFAVDSFAGVKPGVDYAYQPSAAPSCGANVPAATFAGPGAHKLSGDEIAKLGAFFNSPILTGGQVAPRMYRWFNPNQAVFLQWNAGNPSATAQFNPAAATQLRYIGLAVRGEFCKGNQPSADFPHFHRYDAPAYAEGHGGPAHTKGIWLLWVAVDSLDLQGRQVAPGVDRLQSVIPIEQSC